MRYFTILLVFLLLISPATAQNFKGRAFLYVNNNDFENSVTAYSISETGQLRPISVSSFLTGGLGGKTSGIGGLCICRRVRQLYVTNNADDSVTGFKINADGTLTRLPGTPVFTGGRFPGGVICNKRGDRL